MTLAITGLYAALLTAFYLVLSARVIAYRRGKKLSLGDGGDPVMTARIRAHANFAEYAPLGLILLGIAEVQGHGAPWLHLTGGLLLVGRVMHGVNFSFAIRNFALRTGGILLTFTALALGAGLALPT